MGETGSEGAGGKTAVEVAFAKLFGAARRQPYASLEERVDRLERLASLLVSGQEAFVAAIDADFGGRSAHESRLVDVVLALKAATDALAHVHEWMRPQPVAALRWFRPGRAFFEYVPKGVVGVIAPWNYPVNLALSPVAGALAAGNRVLLKPSELTPRTAALLAERVRDLFSAEEIAVVEGGPEVARALTLLPLDHLVFTGSTAVGRQVGLAAAAALTPVTLELGGKSPALVHPDYPMAKAAARIALGKLFNGGQTCIAPDYALIAAGREAAFTEHFTATVQRAYPNLADNPQYTAVVNDRHHQRLLALVEDAVAKGAQVQTVAPHGAPKARPRRMAPVLLFGVNDQMRVMQEEIFGPLLPVWTYRSVDEAVTYINDHPRPLSFYYFDDDDRRVADVLHRVVSGDATVNDTMIHFAQESLPFGGIGASGIGAYHGEVGFRTFSHPRGVMVASGVSPARRLLAPPYGRLVDAGLKAMTSRVGRWLGA
ncbi:MAG: aldehyde dehydrogenase family protein [Deltaproteobacteria bacterium]|nr:aldehyde dehydrogenase family protein [Deltaproteobacteria bacterium]